MWIMCSTFQRCSNLCRMVCVIINDGHSADFTFVFKTAVCSVEGSKTCLDRLRRNTKNIGNCDCRKCVIYVVLTANCKNEMCNILSVFYDIERGIALFVISNIGCTVIQGSFFAKSDNTTGKIGGDLFNFINISVDDESSVFRKKLSKKVERITDIVQVFKKVQVIRIHIQNNTDFREKVQETVGIFACFRNKKVRSADTDIAFDRFQDTADRDCRIQVCCKSNMRKHRGCGCLTVCTGYSNRCLIVSHKLTE